MKLKIEVDIFDDPVFCQHGTLMYRRCNHLWRRQGCCGIFFDKDGWPVKLKKDLYLFVKTDQCKQLYNKNKAK